MRGHMVIPLCDTYQRSLSPCFETVVTKSEKHTLYERIPALSLHTCIGVKFRSLGGSLLVR